MRVWTMAIAALLVLGNGATARAAQGFTGTPPTADEITRGIEDGLHCALGYTSASQISACDVGIARVNLNRRLSPNYPAYSVGLYFEAWRDLDVDWTSDQPLLASHQVSAADVETDENTTKAMYLLFRNARDGLGITDQQLLALTKLSPQGKAHTWARLQYWAKRMR